MREPRPQGEVQRHAGIGYELAQNLDVPLLHMVEQLPDVLQFFATCLPVVAEQGYRRAQDLTGQDSAALGGLSASAADGGPAGGSAHDCGAERRHSSSWWWRANRVQHRRILRRNAFLIGLWSRSYSLLLRNVFLSGLWRRPSIFLKISAQDKVHPLRTSQLVFLKLWMSLVKVFFFALLPKTKKNATLPPHSRSELPPHSSPWTPAAYDASMVLEEEDDSEV